jgi:hypothetical protein
MAINSFRQRCATALLSLLVPWLGTTITASAQTGSRATIKYTSLQETDPDLSDVSREWSSPPDARPTGAVNKKRINSINNQISLIKELVAKEQEQARRAAAEEAKQAQLKKLEEAKAARLLAAPEIMTNSPEPDPATSKPNPPEASADSGTPVVAQPINPLKLANSLFRTGNIEASRKSYTAGLADATPEEKVWLQCLIGCCYRLEGNFAKAESTFRDVTNQREGSYAVDYAKWSLEYLDQRRNSTEKFVAIESEIENILTMRKKTRTKK